MQDVEEALGQYLVYLTFLENVEPERKLYLATSDLTYGIIAESKAIQMLLHKYQISLLIVNPERKEIIAWMQS
jgi:XisH protein